MAGRENERTHAGYFDYLRLIAAFSGIFMHTAAGGACGRRSTPGRSCSMPPPALPLPPYRCFG